MDSLALWIGGNALALSLALLLDAVLGEPDWAWRRVPHPVVLIGRLITWLDRTTNREEHTAERRFRNGVQGIILVLFVVGGVTLGAWLLAHAIHPGLGVVFAVLVGGVLVAQRSMHDHVAAVVSTLEDDGVEQARQALSMIVGRETAAMDENAISRAALESLAENHSDGVIAPAFWFLVGGPMGIAVYKAINTADSMIGYRNDRYQQFGWASAKLDDVVNWLPARLSVGLIYFGAIGAKLLRYPAEIARPNLTTVRQDALTHASPNAGWPEAAYASTLGVALGGPRTYSYGKVEAPYINASGKRQLNRADIRAGLLLFHATCAATLFLVFLIGIIAL